MIETLLIIEDEKLLGSELSRHYRQSGWDVVLATNLAEARALLLEKKVEPLLILSDMNLPDGNAGFHGNDEKASVTDDSRDGGTTQGWGGRQRMEQLPSKAGSVCRRLRDGEVKQCRERLPVAVSDRLWQCARFG
jgi:CheY-like chemotaxis protein